MDLSLLPLSARDLTAANDLRCTARGVAANARAGAADGRRRQIAGRFH